MESIIYNISNCYFPVTVYLKEGYVPGGTVIATNTHNFAGEYSFDNVLEGQYTIYVVDAFGCTKMINTPPIEEDCELDGFIECGLTTTTLEVTTTLSPTTTEMPTTTLEATTTEEVTTTIIDATTTLAPSCVEYGLLYNFQTIENINQVAPEGYRVATLADFVDLIDYLGGENVAGGVLKSLTTWTPPNTGATDGKDFTALPSGIRSDLGVFSDILFKTNIWMDNR